MGSKQTAFSEEVFKTLSSTWKLIYFPEVDSTNAQAKHAITQGAAESGSIYLADTQSAGVGRRGSAWKGGDCENLLFSLVLETGISALHIPRLGLAVGVAIAASLADTVEAQVKWPNDVYVTDKKIAGILVEHIDDFTIIGVGMNVNQQHFEQDLTATSLQIETGEFIAREPLLAHLADKILKFGSLCIANFDVLRQEFTNLDYLHGKVIEFQSHGERLEGIAQGISESGELLVEVNGEISSYTNAASIQLI